MDVLMLGHNGAMTCAQSGAFDFGADVSLWAQHECPCSVQAGSRMVVHTWVVSGSASRQ